MEVASNISIPYSRKKLAYCSIYTPLYITYEVQLYIVVLRQFFEIFGLQLVPWGKSCYLIGVTPKNFLRFPKLHKPN